MSVRGYCFNAAVTALILTGVSGVATIVTVGLASPTILGGLLFIVIIILALAVFSFSFPRVITNNIKKKNKEVKICTQCYSKELEGIELFKDKNFDKSFKAYECQKCNNIIIRKN